MNTTALVSVVVPVYKAENSIEKCVNSILTQTYKKFELILVDDGSPDDSGKICDDLAKTDDRIKVIHKQNGGVSSARNAGIDAANGEYLIFVDSDDWVEENHIEVLLPIEDEDLVYGGRKFFVHGIFVEERKITSKIANKSEWVSDFRPFGIGQYTLFFPSACYKLEIVKNNSAVFDSSLSIGEDGLFNLNYMKFISKIRYEESCTYCYEDGDVGDITLSRCFNKDRMHSEMLQIKTIEEITGKTEHILRHHHWLSVLNHTYKWKTIGTNEVKRQARQLEKECYKNEYFRECIPYMRKHGTLDQRIETYFMSYWMHPLYKPFYSLIAGLSKIKKFVVRK